jgi:hypothetical protein
MAIVNTVARILPGFGSPLVALKANAALTATATTTLAISPTITSGWIRVKLSGPNAATTTILQVTVTDGTTTVEFSPTTITTAGNSVDILIPFCLDISINSVSVIATLGGATHTGTLDFEVAGNP